MPDDDSSSDGDIERMLSAELWNFQTAVTGIDHLLMNTLHLVAKNNSIFLILQRYEILQHRRAMSLFDRKYLISLCLELRYCLKGRRIIAPGDTILSTQSRLMDLSTGRC